LSKYRVARRAVEAMQQSCMAELEWANAELRVELIQSHIKIAEMQAHQDSLFSGYDRLSDEFKELQGVTKAVQREKTDVNKSCKAQVTKARASYQKYRVHFRQRLCDLHCNLESVLGKQGAQCLPYLEKGTPIGDVVTWFQGGEKSLSGTITQANKNFVCFAIADILIMLQVSGYEHLLRLHQLVSSSDASLLDDILAEV
jgi:hypothetical protein